MRIGFSTSVIQRGKSGVAQYVFGVLKQLLPYADRHDFSLFVLEEDLALFDFAQGAMLLVPVSEQQRSALRNVYWHQTVLPRLCRKLGLDLLHVPSYRRMLWSRPCTLTATIHDLAAFHVRGKYDPARMLYGRVVARQLAHRQDAIIAISNNTARDIERFFGIPRSHQTTIWNGIDHGRFCPGDRAAAQAEASGRWGLEAPFFLYVSRLEHPGKNHLRLINAFEQFRREAGTRWLLALAGSDWHGADVIHARATQSPFREEIRFLGFVEESVLPTLYRAASAFVYPSLFEGFGLPPIEAMACDCPVISSARGALEEVLGNAAVIIDPESVSSIAAALRSLALDPAERGRLQALGRSNAARFDWARTAAALVQVWERTGIRPRLGLRT